MSARTTIEWCDATWNPVRGCSRVSEGCRNCYAERVAARFSSHPDNLKFGGAFDGFAEMTPTGPRWTGRVELVPDKLLEPLRWKRPRRIFVNSMSDLFHEALPDADIDRIFAAMSLARQHTFLVLTKRPKRMHDYFDEAPIDGRAMSRRLTRILRAGDALPYPPMHERRGRYELPVPNVWLGVSVEDQKTADERIPLLLETPAAVRFVSYEPALGPVDFGMSNSTCSCCARWPSRWIRTTRPIGPDLPYLAGKPDLVADAGVYRAESNAHGALSIRTPSGLIGVKPGEFECLPALDWIIVGGESGPGARPFDVAWARATIRACRGADIACFVKQLGADPSCDCGTNLSGWARNHGHRGAECARCGASRPLRDRKGGDPSEWAEDLRVREFPRAEVAAA